MRRARVSLLATFALVGAVPSDGQSVEIVVESFTFAPAT
jgi:hypothetical protein